jgi:hypothetical protein
LCKHFYSTSSVVAFARNQYIQAEVEQNVSQKEEQARAIRRVTTYLALGLSSAVHEFYYRSNVFYSVFWPKQNHGKTKVVLFCAEEEAVKPSSTVETEVRCIHKFLVVVAMLGK